MMNKSTKQIIEEINLIVNGYWKFDTELNFNHCSPVDVTIEDLNMLYFKKIKNVNKIKDTEIINKIKENDYGKVEIINIGGIGTFINVVLYKN